MDDPDFEDLVSTIHLISETVADHGFGDRLLAAAFSFEFQRRNAYWIYNYKSGKFYPFVASGERERDNATELRLGEVMKEQRLPVERRLERWHALWGIPFWPEVVRPPDSGPPPQQTEARCARPRERGARYNGLAG